MKRKGVLNKDLSEVIAAMGHMDMLVIGDAGLPIPKNVRRIDLAVSPGIPSFLDVLNAVEGELSVERIIVAEEIKEASPTIFTGIKSTFPETDVRFVSHDELKKLSSNSVAVVRTGEFTPYANIILISGVVF